MARAWATCRSALLAGGQPTYLPTLAANNFRMPFEQITPDQWRKVQLIYVCSPGNPTGHVMTLQEWEQLFELSDRYQFVIASDECYSEIYWKNAPPGTLKVAGPDFANVVVFHSLS